MCGSSTIVQLQNLFPIFQLSFQLNVVLKDTSFRLPKRKRSAGRIHSATSTTRAVFSSPPAPDIFPFSFSAFTAYLTNIICIIIMTSSLRWGMYWLLHQQSASSSFLLFCGSVGYSSFSPPKCVHMFGDFLFLIPVRICSSQTLVLTIFVFTFSFLYFSSSLLLSALFPLFQQHTTYSSSFFCNSNSIADEIVRYPSFAILLATCLNSIFEPSGFQIYPSTW